MRFLGDITPVLLAFLISTTAAAPQAEAAPGCIVPLVIFESLSKPFTLAALIPGPSTSTSQASIPVRITPFTPTKKTSSKPIISRAKIASTQFKLQNGKLIAAGFKAELLPSLAIFPPPLEAFVFGGNSPTSPINFSAGYACDSTGDVFLELLVEQENTTGFVVKKVAEGEQVFIRPQEFIGKAVKVPLKINGGV